VPSITVGGLSRVTIVAPQSRVDLAIPADVPLADLLPTLLRYAGKDLADDGAAQGGWVLARLGGITLDSARTPAQLDVRDGDMLYLTPRASSAPEVVFDDVVDAVATATQGRSGRWKASNARRFALTLGVLALLGGAVAILTAGPPQLPGALIGLGVGLALVVTGLVLSRAAGNSRAGAVFAAVGLAYGMVGGLLVLAGNRPLTGLTSIDALLAGTALVIYAALAAVAVVDATPMFLAAVGVGLAIDLGAAICLLFGSSAAGGAAIVCTVAFALLPATPMLSYRMAKLPIPTVPADPEDLKTDNESVDGQRVLAQSDRADAFLTAMLGWVSVVGVGALLVLSVAHGLADLILATVLAVLLLSRARWFLGLAQRLPLLVAGAVGLGVVAVAVFLISAPIARLTLVLGGVIVIAVTSIGYGLAGSGRQGSPMWGRVLDIIETLLIVSIVPLAVWVVGLYGWIRAVKG
jgi:type VII secretion integral membrane protein EccD